VELAAIAGEAMPVEKLAGVCRNHQSIGSPGDQADKLGRDITFGKIIEAVEVAGADSEDGRSLGRLPRVLRLGSRSSDFIITHNIRSTISVVIVAGACGIAAGTPLSLAMRTSAPPNVICTPRQNTY
jgi:hypothetical protein